MFKIPALCPKTRVESRRETVKSRGRAATVVLGLSLFALMACAQPTLEVVVPLAIVSVSPHDGATGILVTATPVICFNLEMDATRAAGTLVLEKDGVGEVADQSPNATGDAHCLSIAHTDLEPDTLYVIRAKQGLKSANGTNFAVEASSNFRTK